MWESGHSEPIMMRFLDSRQVVFGEAASDPAVEGRAPPSLVGSSYRIFRAHVSEKIDAALTLRGAKNMGSPRLHSKEIFVSTGRTRMATNWRSTEYWRETHAWTSAGSTYCHVDFQQLTDRIEGLQCRLNDDPSAVH